MDSTVNATKKFTNVSRIDRFKKKLESTSRRGSPHPVTCLCFHSQQGNRFLLSGSTSGQIRIWNLKSRRPAECLDGHDKKGILTVFSGENGSIISHGRDERLNIWTLEEGRHDITDAVPVPCRGFCKCDLFQRDHHKLIATPGSETSEVRVYDYLSHEVVKKLVPPRNHQAVGMPMCLKVLSERLLCVGYEDGTIVIWDLTANKIIAERKFFKDPVMCLDFSIDLMKGVCGSVEDAIASWTLDDSSSSIDLGSEVRITNPGVSDIAIREDGRIVASAGWDSWIRIFGMKKLKPLAVLSYHTQSVQCLAFSARLAEFNDQRLLAAGSKDKHISIWSIYNG